MSFTDFASGFFNSVSNTVNTEINKRNELDFLEKQERIREKLRREAEDRRVAAKTIIQGDTSQGPAQLLVEEYNPSGRLIGTRLASKGEEEKHVTDKQTRAANLAAATADAEAKARKENREELKLESQLARDKASTAASYASAESSRAYAKNLASPTGNEEDAMKDVTYLLTDPYAREAIDAGDPNIAGRWGQKPGAIESFIKSALSKAGVEVPEVSPSVMASLSKTEDPAVRAQIIQTYVRELRQAQAQGLGKLKGVKPKTEQ